VIHPAQLQIALEALRELERRDEALSHQWRMRIERADYEAQLAQRRYEEVDPANRLVAATLERRWNDALNQLQETQRKFEDFQATHARATTPQQQEEILALARDFPRLWKAPTTQAKDRKRMLRLLVKDITINKGAQPKQLLAQIRWQGGASETLVIDLPPAIADRLRYPDQLVARVRELAATFPDDQIAETLNRENRRSSKGKQFNASIIRWIRYRHKIDAAMLKHSEELTVQQVAQRFGVSIHVVYYWIERSLIDARRLTGGSPYWITVSGEKERELLKWVRRSSRIRNETRGDSEAVL